MKGFLIKTPNKLKVIYGEVSGGLGQFGPSANHKRRFLNKDKQRMNIVVYGWLQVGLELSFYAIDWSLQIRVSRSVLIARL
ncbi:17305_t:CDS:2 [Funneliformis geosporum]|nr:17305_t:CDS:2 [Funneliformis geosporum]